MNTAGSAGSGTTFYFDYKNSKYGYNTSPSRGADTFVPFKTTPVYEEKTYTKTQSLGPLAQASMSFDAPSDKRIVGIKNTNGYCIGPSHTSTKVTGTIANWNNSSSTRSITATITVYLENKE